MNWAHAGPGRQGHESRPLETARKDGEPDQTGSANREMAYLSDCRKVGLGLCRWLPAPLGWSCLSGNWELRFDSRVDGPGNDAGFWGHSTTRHRPAMLGTNGP